MVCDENNRHRLGFPRAIKKEAELDFAARGFACEPRGHRLHPEGLAGRKAQARGVDYEIAQWGKEIDYLQFGRRFTRMGKAEVDRQRWGTCAGAGIRPSCS
ncbi:MAG TPA: hypothetical protein VHN79_03840 [Lacunisphaera sp.]|nr:hypothetical protein [Lacunisphaera sp.]